MQASPTVSKLPAEVVQPAAVAGGKGVSTIVFVAALYPPPAVGPCFLNLARSQLVVATAQA